MMNPHISGRQCWGIVMTSAWHVRRWEKFAQEKGIQKRKRSVKVWDEDQQEWRRRFGYQKAGDDNDIPIVVAGANDQVRMPVVA